MLATTLCYGLGGIDGLQITVEVNLSSGLPMFDIAGLQNISANHHPPAQPVDFHVRA